MKKQRLIPMIILFIMIMNCLLPVLPVKAATSKAIILNGELYNAVKEELANQKITASYNDSQRRIVISENELLKVTSMDLSNSEISDILGLENFANIISLDLSGNELTSESNLDILSGLKLEFLDLSSNKIEDVSMITNFSEISEINLHGQNIFNVEVISLDTSSDSDHKARVEIKLPQILSLEEIDADWLEVGFNDNPNLKPIWTSLSRDENNVPTLTLDVAIYDGNIEEYIIFDGALEININIGDTNTELEDTNICLFFVVIDNEQRAAIFKDDNFYNVAKRQLTDEQHICQFVCCYGDCENCSQCKKTLVLNEDLRTYPDKELDANNNLYLKAYDKAKVMVFDFNTLINEIPTLRASNYEISDISGLETFVGLEDILDLSYNYIESIDKLLELQENKEIEEEKLQAKFKKQITEVIAPIRGKLMGHLTAIDAINEEIKATKTKIAAIEEIIEKLVDALGGSLTEEQKNAKIAELEKKTEEILNLKKLLEPTGYETENGYVPSLPELKEKEIVKANKYFKLLKPEMEKLYQIYNREYKATSLLTVELYDMKMSKFTYLTKTQAKELLNSLIAKIEKLESSKSLTEIEKAYFKNLFGYAEMDEFKNKITNPISTHLKEEIVMVEEIANSGTYKEYIAKILLIDVMSQLLSNYSSLYLKYEYMGDVSSLTSEEAEEIIEKALKVFLDDAGEVVCSGYEVFEWVDVYVSAMLASVLETDTVDVEKAPIINMNLGEMLELPVDVIKSTNEIALGQIIGISGKFVNLTDEEIKRWITLPDLEKVNLQNNKIEEIDGIENLIKLEVLNVSENEIVNISDIDWSKLTELKELDLHFNFISDVSELSKIEKLLKLNVANNLLSGKFDLNIAMMKNLVEADFSQNAYTDIGPLIQQYRLIAKDHGMDVNEYIMNKVDIKLYEQEISIDLDEKILIGSGDSETIRKVKLPAIIKQFEELDSKRTVFGTKSIYGKISADGTVGLIISNEVGNHNGLVTVETKKDSEGLSVGHGTVCKINYTVTSAMVKDIIIESNRDSAIRGGKTQFEAFVEAVNVWDTSVTWTVEGKTSNDTKIDENGLLTVGEDETADKLTVRATSNYDNSKYIDKKVNVVEAEVKVILQTSSNSNGIEAGTSKVYEAVVVTEADNKQVTWSISGNTSENTVINNEGLLKVGKDEAHGAKITVKATSEYNNEVYDYVVEVVKVGESIEKDPVEEKIKVKYDTKDDIVYAEKPNMTIADFVKGLVDGEHTITVTDGEGNVITDYTKPVVGGMVVNIDDSVKDTYEIVVTGDINGDGKVDSTDSAYIREHRVETNKLEGTKFEAADIDKDGKINKVDSFLLLYYRAGKIEDFSKATIETVMK